MEPFFTIVLPIYNAKKYIKETIDSIMNQDFNDFELLLVDDGSSDGSGEIAKHIASLYGNAKYFKKANGGICNARNYGLKKSSGRYIMFCDHDDIFEPQILRSVYDILKKKKSDILKFSYLTSVVVNNNILKQYENHCFNQCITSTDLKNNYTQFNNFINTIWNGAYSRKFLDENGIEFDEDIKYGQEDVIFNLKVLNCNCHISMFNRKGYHHFIRYGQSTSRKFNINKLEAIIKSLRLEKNFLNPLKAEMKIALTGKYIRSYFVSIGMIHNPFNKNDIKTNFLEFKNELPQIKYTELIKQSRNHMKDVVKIFLFYIRAYRILIKIMGIQ